MDNKNNSEEKSTILSLNDEHGNQFDFEYLDVIEYEGKEYIFLLPADNESTEIIIMEIEPVDEENENYVPVEDEELLQAVYGLFKEKYKDILTFDD